MPSLFLFECLQFIKKGSTTFLMEVYLKKNTIYSKLSSSRRDVPKANDDVELVIRGHDSKGLTLLVGLYTS